MRGDKTMIYNYHTGLVRGAWFFVGVAVFCFCVWLLVQVLNRFYPKKQDKGEQE
jgi:hypothetical protein